MKGEESNLRRRMALSLLAASLMTGGLAVSAKALTAGASVAGCPLGTACISNEECQQFGASCVCSPSHPFNVCVC